MILKLERKFNWVVGLCLVLIYFKVLQGLLVTFCLRGFICLLQWNGMGALWRSECMVAVAVRVSASEIGSQGGMEWMACCILWDLMVCLDV